jgi:alkanesulfonate monooxygenase SsuD/methylene tetrahydromethanopterin reductase-like flavin-dependent oxidoreductase (luciferase family)
VAFTDKPRFGLTIFPTDYSIQPVELAQAAEARGFESLFFPEHTHIPASRQSPFPGGGDLPKMYWHSHDPFVALGACAGATSTIRLGTGICLVIERDPITLAKEVASLDMISNGRFVLGIGAGWNREEMENHGADYRNRWKIVREKVLAMKAIWTEEVAEYADGWMPIGGLGSGNMERMTEALAARGRKIEDMDLALFGAPHDHDQLKGRIEQGFDELVFSLPDASAEKVLPLLDKLAELVVKIRG